MTMLVDAKGGGGATRCARCPTPVATHASYTIPTVGIPINTIPTPHTSHRTPPPLLQFVGALIVSLVAVVSLSRCSPLRHSFANSFGHSFCCIPFAVFLLLYSFCSIPFVHSLFFFLHLNLPPTTSIHSSHSQWT